jgi:DNA-binding response OmpR family regulator
VSATGDEGPERGGLRILLVDDDPSMARLVQQILRAHGFPSPTHVTTGHDALASADQADVVLLDQQLPDVAGLDLLEALHARAQPPAVILVTAHGNESLAARALRQGAEDYLAKDQAFADLLPQVLERVRRNRALRDALAAAEQELVRTERLAALGELTVTLHHEINNPLMAASAEVELLLSSANEESRPALAAIKTSLNRIRDILRRIRDLRDTPSTEYLSGLRMLDLSGGGAVREVQRGTAVLAVPDESVARVAALLLRTAGFTVARAATPEELERAVGAVGVTLVLVSARGGAPGTDPLGGFRPPPARRYRVVALSAGHASAAAAAGADHVMFLPFDPGTFVGEILAVLEKQRGQ